MTTWPRCCTSPLTSLLPSCGKTVSVQSHLVPWGLILKEYQRVDAFHKLILADCYIADTAPSLTLVFVWLMSLFFHLNMTLLFFATLTTFHTYFLFIFFFSPCIILLFPPPPIGSSAVEIQTFQRACFYDSVSIPINPADVNVCDVAGVCIRPVKCCFRNSELIGQRCPFRPEKGLRGCSPTLLEYLLQQIS